jgi:hypothetical protein
MRVIQPAVCSCHARHTTADHVCGPTGRVLTPRVSHFRRSRVRSSMPCAHATSFHHPQRSRRLALAAASARTSASGSRTHRAHPIAPPACPRACPHIRPAVASALRSRVAHDIAHAGSRCRELMRPYGARPVPTFPLLAAVLAGRSICGPQWPPPCRLSSLCAGEATAARPRPCSRSWRRAAPRRPSAPASRPRAPGSRSPRGDVFPAARSRPDGLSSAAPSVQWSRFRLAVIRAIVAVNDVGSYRVCVYVIVWIPSIFGGAIERICRTLQKKEDARLAKAGRSRRLFLGLMRTLVFTVLTVGGLAGSILAVKVLNPPTYATVTQLQFRVAYSDPKCRSQQSWRLGMGTKPAASGGYVSVTSLEGAADASWTRMLQESSADILRFELMGPGANESTRILEVHRFDEVRAAPPSRISSVPPTKHEQPLAPNDCADARPSLHAHSRSTRCYRRGSCAPSRSARSVCTCCASSSFSVRHPPPPTTTTPMRPQTRATRESRRRATTCSGATRWRSSIGWWPKAVRPVG